MSTLTAPTARRAVRAATRSAQPSLMSLLAIVLAVLAVCLLALPVLSHLHSGASAATTATAQVAVPAAPANADMVWHAGETANQYGGPDGLMQGDVIPTTVPGGGLDAGYFDWLVLNDPSVSPSGQYLVRTVSGTYEVRTMVVQSGFKLGVAPMYRLAANNVQRGESVLWAVIDLGSDTSVTDI